MSIEGKVSLTISVDKEYRDRLRTMAAQQNLHDPNQLTSASTLAREIICRYFDEIECLEDGVKAIDGELNLSVEEIRISCSLRGSI
jgi:hypothetical protein